MTMVIYTVEHIGPFWIESVHGDCSAEVAWMLVNEWWFDLVRGSDGA